MFNILCIDDNKNNLFTLKAILERLKRVNIITVLSAENGLLALLNEKIDLILLDIQMPDMDGFEAAKIIKSNKQTADIPIIFLTAVFQSEEFHKKGFEVGAIEYLTKPIDDNQLLNKVKLYQQLIEKEKSLIEQKQYMQKIIDLQEQILIVIDKNKFHNANKRFFDFFGYDDLDSFLEEHDCICEFFIEKDGFLPPSYSKGDKPWLNIILSDTSVMHLCIVKYLNTDIILSVNATVLDIKKELYIVTLSDVTQIHKIKEQFRHESLTDKLTGAFNRTKFDSVLNKAILNAENEIFTVAILDIDFFKKVNDTYGHLVGDSILKELVTLIEKNIRTEDLFARWGGEEFTLIFFTSKKKILYHIEKLRTVVQNHKFSGVKEPITVSIGVCEHKIGMNKKELLKNTDIALYNAKASGRNKIVEWDRN